jgi:hypothetical protein
VTFSGINLIQSFEIISELVQNFEGRGQRGDNAPPFLMITGKKSCNFSLDVTYLSSHMSQTLRTKTLPLRD